MLARDGEFASNAVWAHQAIETRAPASYKCTSKRYVPRYPPTREGTSEDHVSSKEKDRPAGNLPTASVSASQERTPVKAARSMLRGDTTQSRLGLEDERSSYVTHVQRSETTATIRDREGRQTKKKCSKQASITLAQALSRPLPAEKNSKTVESSRIRLFCRNGQREKSRPPQECNNATSTVQLNHSRSVGVRKLEYIKRGKRRIKLRLQSSLAPNSPN